MWVISSPELVTHYDEVGRLSRLFPPPLHLQWTHIKRTYNSRADALSTQAILSSDPHPAIPTHTQSQTLPPAPKTPQPRRKPVETYTKAWRTRRGSPPSLPEPPPGEPSFAEWYTSSKAARKHCGSAELARACPKCCGNARSYYAGKARRTAAADALPSSHP